jgi:hypothetical protein
MKRAFLFFVSVTLSLFGAQSASGVLNGTLVTSNKYLVPIEAQYNTTQSSYCSGVMISKNVLVTAGHCVLNENKQVSKLIKVGKPGSQLDSIPSDHGLVIGTFLPDDYEGSTVDNKVGASDLAILVIDRIFPEVEEMQIASENDLKLLKTTEGSLRALGYGSSSDTSSLNKNPYYFDGSFVNYEYANRANTFVMTSKTAGVCFGDSGGPVVNITPKKILLLGVITGSSIPTGNCTKPNSSGQYIFSFSGISRYSNVLHLALVKGQEELIKLGKTFEEDAKSAKGDLDSVNSEIAFLKTQIEQKDAELAILKSMKKVITCISGKKTKQVTATNPVCPAGYKLKK